MIEENKKNDPKTSGSIPSDDFSENVNITNRKKKSSQSANRVYYSAEEEKDSDKEYKKDTSSDSKTGNKVSSGFRSYELHSKRTEEKKKGFFQRLAEKRANAPLTNDVESIIISRGGIDRQMFLIVILLVSLGSIMVFSASYAYAYSRYGDSTYFIRRQLLFAIIGFIAMAALSFVPYRVFKKFSVLAYIATLGLLMLVLVIGTAEGAAKRWIYIGGISIQPSEIMKVSLVLMLAWFADKYRKKVIAKKHFWQSSFYGVFFPMIFVALACILVVLENHISGTIIIFAIGMLVIWMSGGKNLWFAIFVLCGVALVSLVILTTDYGKERIDLWLHPENFDPLGKVWQSNQGKIAIGSGGLFGTGIGKSRQKHLFVSQPQNDFIYSIICEELGFVGGVGVLVLFMVFAWRGFKIAQKAPDVFASVTAAGITCHVGIQALLNILVVTGIFPNTGISLPFFSYGGSSLIMLMAEMGVLLSISRYSKIEK